MVRPRYDARCSHNTRRGELTDITYRIVRIVRGWAGSVSAIQQKSPATTTAVMVQRLYTTPMGGCCELFLDNSDLYPLDGREDTTPALLSSYAGGQLPWSLVIVWPQDQPSVLATDQLENQPDHDRKTVPPASPRCRKWCRKRGISLVSLDISWHSNFHHQSQCVEQNRRPQRFDSLWLANATLYILITCVGMRMVIGSIVKLLGWIEFGDDPDYQKARASGWHPYFDLLPPEINNDSVAVHSHHD